MHEIANYRVDDMIPLNTRVRIGDSNERVIKVSVPETGERFRIIKIRKYTNQDIATIFHCYFAAKREAIESGEIEHGMSKDAVLIARGFPSAHE